jgi:hypothetical protein
MPKWRAILTARITTNDKREAKNEIVKTLSESWKITDIDIQKIEKTPIQPNGEYGAN